MHSEKTILSTKILSENLIHNGNEKVYVKCIAFIETIPYNNQQIQEKIPERDNQIHQAIFTSANALHAVKDLPFLKSIQHIYTISGNGTEKSIKEFAQGNVTIHTASNASTLADLIIDQKSNTPCYFFCGNIRLDVLPKKLINAGIRFFEIPVYHTKLTPQIITKQYDAILFFSPSAVESFFSVNNLSPHTVVYAIGDTTAESIKKFCDNQLRISSSANAKVLLNETIHFLCN